MSSRNFVNLNVNPCKMCMPMGAVQAFKGIENSMVILHGSQGCSTYIRRHMATHYNEPIDIASSSLTENGTVYGGSENLKTGLKNMIKLYKPAVIGITTTCLAETIGEDINRIVNEFYEEEAHNEEIKKLKIVTVPTPGYGGTQAEGYYRSLRKIVEQMTVDTDKHNKINIICGNINPADVRNIKRILDLFDVEYTMLPDVSNTLDSPHNEKYTRIPQGGTKTKDIEKMGGAVATIEMGMTIADDESAGVFLQEKYGVPLYKCEIPIGLRNTDKFVDIISQISKKPIPEELKLERGRLLDAMIDNHKFNGEAKAIIYGEPELVLALVKAGVENGIVPKLVAIGAKNRTLKNYITDEVKSICEDIVILDDTDFETIEMYAKKLNPNIIIGNSDGRRMAKRLGIEIMRIGFPIHDRVGAQRQTFTGYNGTALFIDGTANIILAKDEDSFREEAYDMYYRGEERGVTMNNIQEVKEEKVETVISIEDKTKTHPCYNAGAHDHARMHIPVAPKCNISCNYCNRKYDCPNETRPGVTSEVLSPEQALAKFKLVKEKVPNLSVLGIAGPGDALANFEQVKKSIQLIKEEDPSITFCLSTNGLMLPFYANELIELGVSHVTVTMNTVDPKLGGKIYKEVNYLGSKYTGEEGAGILLNNQLTGLKYLSSKGIMCKVNIVMIKGINDDHIEEVVKKVKECGVFMTNIMKMIPVVGSAFEGADVVSNEELNDMRKKCGEHVKQMYHCRQCRADAIGTLNNDCSADFRYGCGKGAAGPTKEKEKIEIPAKEEVSLKFAVASKTGINVDEHFGHAEEFYIYGFSNGKASLLEKRNVEKYCTGVDDCDAHDNKIEKILRTIKDCNAVLTMRIGDSPEKKLEENGIRVFKMYDEINCGIDKVAEELRR
ncbi:MAG: nitrogenase cofactor biosynthesis protein NifB [Bacillota bacterium]|nr:nitrogenase cofactor biosynthesis protein NifB [Bacillota bacterium]